MAVDKPTEIKELLEIIKHKVDIMETSRIGQSASISLMRDQLSVMNIKIDEMKKTLDSHTGSLITIESKLDAYGDMYDMNKDNIRKLDERLDILEEDAGVEVPPELQLADVS